MKTLTLQEAANLLKIHPVTLLNKVNAGEVPGAKIGKCWVFVEVDLVEHIRSRYREDSRGTDKGGHATRQTSASAFPHIGGPAAHLTLEQNYQEALGMPQEPQHRNRRTS